MRVGHLIEHEQDAVRIDLVEADRGQRLNFEQYALMLPRGDADFRLAVNRVLARLYRSGDIRRVYDRWLGPLGPPSPLLSATYFIQGLAE